MLAAIVWMIIYLRICIRGSWYDAAYCGLQAFIIAAFAASLEWQCYCYFLYDNTSVLIEYLVLLAVYVVIYLTAWRLWSLPKNPDRILNIKPGELLAAALIAGAIFAVSNINYLPVTTLFSSSDGPAVASIRTIVGWKTM